ncbi:MAG: sigma-70 family RNA polymerase sigma factor [Verrucomicrobia bacterium]|nr:sigma-70 family RNA polymerase sigma factor [Verrucomicrobiota bacterium]
MGHEAIQCPSLFTELIGIKATPSPVEPALDVPACLRRVRDGEEDAARLLLSHLYPLVMKLVRAHLPRRTSEEDLAQTVFMKVFKYLDQYSGRVPLEHWVSRITINTCLNELRVERVRPELRWSDLSEDESRVLDQLASTASQLDPTERIASQDLIHKLMERLTPANRLLIHLLHLEERSVDEVKQLTGWNRSLIKVRAFRARQKMKKHLEKLLEGEDL